MSIALLSGLGYGEGGQRLDVYHPEDSPGTLPIVLLWHGRGPDERDVLTPLARHAASLGLVCVVPDWRPDAPDGGRTHLRESVEFGRRHGADFSGDPGRITLAGWSLGGKTAVAVALDPGSLDGWRPRAVVAIAGGYTTPDPLTGRATMDRLAAGGDLAPAVPLHLVHGTADDIVDITQPRRLHAALRARDWPSALTELDADHAGVVMTEYDPEARRCRPSESERVLRAGSRTAHIIAEAASREDPALGASVT